MPDPHLEAVPPPPSTDLTGDFPVIPVMFDLLADPAAEAATAPLVEPLDTFVPRLQRAHEDEDDLQHAPILSVSEP